MPSNANTDTNALVPAAGGHALNAYQTSGVSPPDEEPGDAFSRLFPNHSAEEHHPGGHAIDACQTSGVSPPKLAAIKPIVDRVRRTDHWGKASDGPKHRCKPLTDALLTNHASGEGVAVGACPIERGSSTTRLALLDLDSHKGESSWPEMSAAARRLIEAGAVADIVFVPFRSSGGRGIHLYAIWDEEQDARSVRAMLADLLVACGFKNGTRGVRAGEAEILPKQDSVPADGWGNMFILPGAGESAPLDPVSLDEIEWDAVAWSTSDPVPVVAKPVFEASTVGTPPELADVRDALDQLDPNDFGYDEWVRILFAVHAGTDASEDGRALFHEWSSKFSRYTPEETDKQWNAAKIKPGGIGIGTLFKLAGEATGWQPPGRRPDASGFEALGVFAAAPEQGQVAIAFEYRPFGRLTARPAPQRWVWHEWLPRGHVSALFGRGGVGKTLLAQQIVTHVATGTPLLGAPVEQGPTLTFLCEDDGDTLDRRQWDICGAMMRTPADVADKVLVESRLGKDNLLATFDRARVATPTALLRAIEAEVAKHRPVLVVIDNIAQVYAGDLNVPGEATQFVNLLAGIAGRHDCAVLLLGHVAKAEGSEFTGTAAWENSIRSRLFFTRDENEEGLMRLARPKANYAKQEEGKALRYEEGYFREVTPEQVKQEKREKVVDLKPLLLAAAEKLVAEGVKLSPSNRSPNAYLPAVAQERGLLPDDTYRTGKGEQPVDQALRDLIRAGDLVVVRTPWRDGNRKRLDALLPARFGWYDEVVEAAGIVGTRGPAEAAEEAVKRRGLAGDEKALHLAKHAVAEAIRRGSLKRSENGCISITGIEPLKDLPLPDGYIHPTWEDDEA